MLSSTSYVGNGVGDTFVVSFTFISEDYVHVYLDGIETSEYSWLSSSSIQFSSPPANDVSILIQRETPIDVKFVDFQNGSILDEKTLDLNTDQILHVAQELYDKGSNAIQLTPEDVFDALGKRVNNLGTPIDPTDAVTKAYADAVILICQQYEGLALSHKNAAGASETNAGNSETAAGLFATNASNSANTASTKAGEAAGSANAADVSAGLSEASKLAAVAAKDLAVASKDTAVTKAGEASTSASQALSSKNAAGVSETNAAASALAAATSEGNAGVSATNASGSASTASTKAVAAEYWAGVAEFHGGDKEPALGNPSENGLVLSSTAAGVRSWIKGGGGNTEVHTMTPTAGVVNISAVVKNTVRVTLDANVTSIVLPAGEAGVRKDLVIQLVQDATGGRTVTGWPSLLIEGGVIPSVNSLANSITQYVLTNTGNTGWVMHVDENRSGLPMLRIPVARRHIAGASGGTALSAFTLVSHRIYYVPFTVPRAMTLVALGVSISTLLAGTGRLGIYENAPETTYDRPGKLLVEGGSTINTGATGTKVTTVDITLEPGVLYWAAWVTSSASGIRAVPVAGLMPSLGWTDNSTTVIGFMYESAASATLPTESTATLTAMAAVTPAIYLCEF